ncbi:MAG: beta-N-acetylhexosaminidase [Planctomycetota bacterium]|jgi:hexosaminidase
MTTVKTALAACLALSAARAWSADDVRAPVVPLPRDVRALDGDPFVLAPSTVIVFDSDEGRRAGEVLAGHLRPATGFALPARTGRGGAGNIALLTGGADAGLGREGYALTVTSAGVVVRAPGRSGLVYGGSTLRQLLPVEIFGKEPARGTEWKIAPVEIVDAPRFAWRAFMLDESRYFKGEGVVRDLLDEMALLKLNVFHWHLVDDQGWRLEIKRYPKLTEVGSKRRQSQIGGWRSEKRDGTPHGGFYTQAQVREIVRYADERGITIVPEIEMPGHATAAIASYPELGTTREPVEVPERFGKHPHCFNAADENVYKMLSEILDEVVALFPSEVVHIGGDEVRFGHWSESKEIRALMEREGMRRIHDVQTYFTNRISRIVEKKGRRMMGWNEILEGSLHATGKDDLTLSPEAVIHFWKGSPELAKKAIAKGHDVVNSWHAYTYLDYGSGKIGLQKAYEFDPVFKGLSARDAAKVKGLGCQMWGEWIPTVERMQLKIFPRIAAYAEVGWTDLARKDYRGFVRRMAQQCARWKARGVRYESIVGFRYTAKDFEKHRKVAAWRPDMIGRDWAEVDFGELDLNALGLRGAGALDVAFVYTKGRHAIDIASVSLLEDGRPVSTDAHTGFSSARLADVVYRLEVPRAKPGAVYTLRARVRGSGGTDSRGEVKVLASRER